MGDRANVVIKQGDDQVFLYTHWGGRDLFKTVQTALQRGKPRWTDHSYLARIVFCEMLPDDDLKGETGYGISDSITDNEYQIIVLDCEAGRVFLIQEKELVKRRVPAKYNPDESKVWVFEDFTNLSKDPRK